VSRAFMTDPTLLDSIDGQQYLVLRPTGPVADFYDAEQSSLRRSLPDSVSFPNTGHVTLRGFWEPTRVHELKNVLKDWAARQPPITVRVDAVDGFPTPFQVLISRLERSTSLVDAYAALTSALDATDFHRIGELPLDQWVFHLSLIYCNSMSEDDWLSVAAQSAKDLPVRPSELLTTAEFVWYEDGIEHSETVPLGGSPL